MQIASIYFFKLIWMFKTALIFFLNIFCESETISENEQILLYRNDEIGDYFLTLPAVNFLLDKGEVTFMCKEKFHYLKYRNRNELSYLSEDILSWRNLLALYKLLSQFDQIIMFRDSLLLLIFAIIKRRSVHSRIGFRNRFSSSERENLPEVSSHLMQVKAACGIFEKQTNSETHFDYNFLDIHHFSKYRRILIVPGALNHLRQPRADAISKICGLLSKKRIHFRIILFKEPWDYIHSIAQSIDEKHTLDIVRDLTIEEYVKQFEWPELVICADSSAQHVASFFNLPSIVIFGPNTPFVWGPWASNSKSAVLQSVNCRFFPCDQKKCYLKRPCIQNVDTAFVLESIVKRARNGKNEKESGDHFRVF